MRIWSISPRYLDWMGLGAQWREGLLAQKVIQGATRGWRNHPQLNRFKEHPKPLSAAGYYLRVIQLEAERRGYRYEQSKILYPVESVEKILLSTGQLEYEFKILQERLERRAPSKYLENMEEKSITAHPLFTPRSGPPEKWEKSYWRTA